MANRKSQKLDQKPRSRSGTPSHRASKQFWREFSQLSESIQQLAREQFALLKSNPKHPSLHFKRLGRHWCVRIGRSYRAVGDDSPNGILWFWIGSHEEYDQKFC